MVPDPYLVFQFQRLMLTAQVEKLSRSIGFSHIDPNSGRRSDRSPPPVAINQASIP